MMDRATLNARHSALIRKWGRTIGDHDGACPLGLLDELAAIADEHALDVTVLADTPTARTRTRKHQDDDPPAAA